MIIKFKENRVRRAYTGGKRLDRFCGKVSACDGRMPEEWIASEVEAFNPDRPVAGEGLSVCSDGRLFRDVLAEQGERILGKQLWEAYGGRLPILVKLLDSAERIVIQCHPTAAFAREHFHSMFGKTECWYMLDCDADACVYLGFKPGITKEKWSDLFRRQDIEGMLECLHRLPVEKGDLWFVNGGVPHAIGGGCLMVELQEPSDLMVIPERVTPAGVVLAEQKLHCGLGFEKMLDCFCYEGLSEAEIKKRYFRKHTLRDNAVTELVGTDLTECFSMQVLRVKGEARLNRKGQCAVAVVTEGAGTLITEDGAVSVGKSDSFLIGADTGSLTLQGDMQLVFCIPQTEKSFS